jgi:hypothetical protein
MGIREEAAADLSFILSDVDGPASSFVLIAPDGPEYPVAGIIGDIGFLLDQNTGVAIQGRTIEASYATRGLREQTEREPERGWRCKSWDLTGEEYTLFVTRYEPDRTVGVARIKLAVNLK